MATIGYAALRLIADTLGGNDSLVLAVGSEAALTTWAAAQMPAFSIPSDINVNSDTWQVVDDEDGNALQIDGAGSWHRVTNETGYERWITNDIMGEGMLLSTSTADFADAAATSAVFDAGSPTFVVTNGGVDGVILIKVTEGKQTDRRIRDNLDAISLFSSFTLIGSTGGFSYYRTLISANETFTLQKSVSIWTQDQLLTAAEQVGRDINEFQSTVEREALDWQRILAEESIAPHTDSGHVWSDDLAHSLLKPNIRGLEVLLVAAKAAPSQSTIDAYRARLDSFNSLGSDPGIVSIYQNADKSVWRPLRMGSHAYGYDTATGGIRQVGGMNIQFAVTYPTGETVATYDALSAVRAL